MSFTQTESSSVEFFLLYGHCLTERSVAVAVELCNARILHGLSFVWALPKCIQTHFGADIVRPFAAHSAKIMLFFFVFRHSNSWSKMLCKCAFAETEHTQIGDWTNTHNGHALFHTATMCFSFFLFRIFKAEMDFSETKKPRMHMCIFIKFSFGQSDWSRRENIQRNAELLEPVSQCVPVWMLSICLVVEKEEPLLWTMGHQRRKIDPVSLLPYTPR